MIIGIYFNRRVKIMGGVYRYIDSEHKDVINIQTDGSGVSIETATHYYFVPAHSISHSVVKKASGA